MIPPLDPFTLSFDSIEIDPTRTPSQAAIDHALAIAAPSAPDLDAPGFCLVNDADGRFVVDRDMGVVSLRDEALVESERGTVHDVRLRVVEASGVGYELDLPLRITGRVPQVVGAEEFSFSAGPAPVFDAPALVPATPVALAPAPRPTMPWTRFAAVDGAAPEALPTCGLAPYGTLLETSLPMAAASEAWLQLIEQFPAPSAKAASWTI